jgi:hypothetical protein
MAGRCFFLIADAMLISALEFVGVSWTSILTRILRGAQGVVID